MTDEKRIKGSVKERIRTLRDTIPFGASGLELTRVRGRAVLFADGVIGIFEVGECKISLRTHSGHISVSGRKLVLATFEGRRVGIYGRIEGVELGYGRLR